MKIINHVLFLLFTIISFKCYSQISYEKGYYINNSGQKVTCFIKNVDWNNNPTAFEYKETENSDVKEATIKSVSEFGINNFSKYIRSEVMIDRTSEELKALDYDKKPQLKEEELFLRVLVEGESNLYEYVDGNLRKYFYNKEIAAIEPLIFKRYKISALQIGNNFMYKQQLWNDLKCAKITRDQVDKVAYKKTDLVKLFVVYNQCNNHEITNFEAEQKKDLFNLTIRPGLNVSSLSIQNTYYNSRPIDFDAELAIRLGIEVEFIMPFNKNKWALQIEPTYQYFKSEKALETQNVKADYTSIELPLGIRHYFFLKDNSKIFINGSYIFDISEKSVVAIDSNRDLDIESGRNYAFGLGYKHNNKYSIEFRFQTSREIFVNYQFWRSDYKTISLIFGYSIF